MVRAVLIQLKTNVELILEKSITKDLIFFFFYLFQSSVFIEQWNENKKQSKALKEQRYAG